MTKFVINFLAGWRTITEALERTLVDNVAATVPWLAPIAPAYMAFHNVTKVLVWDDWVAWTVGLAIEGLGLAVTSTAFQLWDWNDARKKQDDSAPVWIAVIMVVFYLSVVITVNVLLDKQANTIERVSKALLSLLSLVAAVTLALRAQHARRTDDKKHEKEQQREERKAARELKLQLAKQEGKFQKVAEGDADRPETYSKYKNWRQLPNDERSRVAELLKSLSKKMAMEEVKRLYGVSERSAYDWLKYAEQIEVNNS